MPSLNVITLNHPSELIEKLKLFSGDTFQIQYRDFNIYFELKESNSGLTYILGFEYQHSPRISQIFRIGSEGYSNLILKAMVAKRLPFDVAHNVNQGRLTRKDIIRDHGLEKELLFHVQCIVFLFEIVEQIMNTHKKHYDEYCLEIIRQEELGRIEDSFNSFFLLRACRLLMKGGLEYYGKEIIVDEEIGKIDQLWVN
ncbi:hypothetical protein EBU71_22885 [bacterium]|nr:hypothetical protein [Candidatus Elulimicrobium humile]